MAPIERRIAVHQHQSKMQRFRLVNIVAGLSLMIPLQRRTRSLRPKVIRKYKIVIFGTKSQRFAQQNRMHKVGGRAPRKMTFKK
eukprot:1182982-Ditylum_brightwellii.AAC.1